MSSILQLGDHNSAARRQPFPLLVAHDALSGDVRPALDVDFPRYRGAGYFPHDAGDCGPSINQLVAELTATDVADWVGGRLGIGSLSGFPTLVTLCRSLNARHGTIHTDSRSKVASALLYLNPDWPDSSDGCLRFLARGDDIEALVLPEIRPVYGNLVAFRRTDNSFHGHLPFAGERRVIQVAWLTSEQEKLRKTRRGRASRLLKAVFGGIDRRIGEGRGRNASRPD